MSKNGGDLTSGVKYRKSRAIKNQCKVVQSSAKDWAAGQLDHPPSLGASARRAGPCANRGLAWRWCRAGRFMIKTNHGESLAQGWESGSLVEGSFYYAPPLFRIPSTPLW